MDSESPTWCLIDKLGNVVSVDVAIDDSITLIIDDRLSPLSREEVTQLIRALKNASKWVRKNDKPFAEHIV